MDTIETEEKHPPLHMDKWSRNERLYKTLTEMGLVCSPIFADEKQDKIEALYVSTEVFSLPADVGTPVQRSKITKVITTPRSDGSNVVDFPSVV